MCLIARAPIVCANDEAVKLREYMINDTISVAHVLHFLQGTCTYTVGCRQRNWLRRQMILVECQTKHSLRSDGPLWRYFSPVPLINAKEEKKQLHDDD